MSLVELLTVCDLTSETERLMLADELDLQGRTREATLLRTRQTGLRIYRGRVVYGPCLGLTYEQAQDLTIRRPRRKLGNNTYLVRDGDLFHVELHGGRIITIRPDATYVLRSNGYKTRTTKDRLNTYSPAYIYQRAYRWHLADGTEFTESVIVDCTGTPV